MMEDVGLSAPADRALSAMVRDGQVELETPLDLPDGTKLTITPVFPLEDPPLDGHVIIVGFGLAGRCVADLLDHAGLSSTIIEKNPVTVETQRALGRDIIEGDATDPATIVRAGLNSAAILALTIPDEDSVLDATSLARRLNPDIYIIARTNYSSKGMKATQLGADDVIKAEQAVAMQFYERLSQRLRRKVQATA